MQVTLVLAAMFVIGPGREPYFGIRNLTQDM